jgi:peptidoglycan/xylan/chitin deacetylase (PgdA/CDA1 family)
MSNTNRKKHIWKSVIIRLGLALIWLATLTSAVHAEEGDTPTPPQDQHTVKLAPVEPPRQPTQPKQFPSNIPELPQQPLNPIADSSLLNSQFLAEQEIVENHLMDSRDMKLLVISATAYDQDFPAITAFLDQIGVPYDTLIAVDTQLVPSMLWDGVGHGYYQGIILTSGDLGYVVGDDYMTAFDLTEWETLWEYEAIFGVRQVTSYTAPYGYPEGYGLEYKGYLDTTDSPIETSLTVEGQQVYPYINANNPIPIQYAWVYLSTVDPEQPTTTTPLVVYADDSGEYAIASIHTQPNGRQNLAVTVANNDWVLHSLLLSYGTINWVTNGLFLGERHVSMSPQVDDLLIDSNVWDIDAKSDETGIIYRLTADDFAAAIAWQNNTRTTYATASSLTLEMAYNGEGASGIYTPDTLTPAVKANHSNFNWVNHTYSHLNLDNINYRSAKKDLQKNHRQAKSQFKFKNYFKDSMVQPDISGLGNANFLRAADDFNIRYLISDTSRPVWDNPSPNTGFYSIYEPSLLIIPRRPTNLFYNLTTPDEFVSEYNCYYGPDATCADGQWSYWDHDLSYTEILDKESDMWMRYLLKWDIDPLMFHQANLMPYNGTDSLLGELIDTTLTKYNQVYTLPIRNMSQHEIGVLMSERMAYNNSGVSATLLPCQSITISVTQSARVPITGLSYGLDQETYGGQTITYTQLGDGQSISIPAPGCP